MQNNKKRHVPQEEVGRKIFVLDTNVPMHDPSSLFAFEEHDVHIPPEVIEEIDNHKKGHEEIALNSRHTMRTLDALLSRKGVVAKDGIDLTEHSGGMATGKLFLECRKSFSSLPQNKVDNRILDFVYKLTQKHKERTVVLVSKDINMRIKARMRGLAVEDYHSDMVIKDTDHLETGIHQLPKNFWLTNGNNLHSGVKEGESYYEVTGDFADKLGINQFVYNDESGENQFTGRVKERRGKTTTIVVPRNYITPSNAVWKICARNREQSFALNLLMDPSVDLVTLLGPAGCGKTLLTLAAGFEQVVGHQRRYRKIVFTRTPIPVGEEIGFLPGTEEEKLFPWMGAFTDNLEVLLRTGNGNGDKGKKEEKGKEAHTFQREYIMEKVEIKSLTFMRGRSFLNTFLVVDEAQNLTPRQMKMLVTRAGNGTKVVILGNLDQIDTPYLSAGGSGLAYIVDRFKNYPRGGHLILPEGERSPLANYANTVL